MKTVTFDETKWQLVPKIPTTRMLNSYPDSWHPYNVYKAFIEAAPRYREKPKNETR